MKAESAVLIIPWHLSNESAELSVNNLLYHGTYPMKAENRVLIIYYIVAPIQ